MSDPQKPHSTQPGRRASGRRPQRSRAGWLARLAVVVFIFGLLACACVFTVTRLLAVRIPQPSGGGVANLNPLEALYLDVYLGVRADDLQRQLVPSAEPVRFDVETGSTAGLIADQLARRGLIADAALFRNYVRYTGLDSQLEAGRFRLSASMTIPEIAEALTEALSPDVILQVIEGWRLEQIGEALDRADGLSFAGADFVALVTTGGPPPAFDFLAGLPPGASLEGFLFPDTYRIAPDATAADVRDLILETFDARVTAQLRAEIVAQRFTLYEVVTLASIVEREAVIPEERPLIARVYLNRLATGTKLDADPTVQYAKSAETPGEWWPNLMVSDYTNVISRYNTYINAGLPPGPIANPSLASIEAVVYPENADYLYFRACDASGRHIFSLTFAEHEQACD